MSKSKKRTRKHQPYKNARHTNRHRATASKKAYRGPRRAHQTEPPMTYKDTFFFQVTACGILTLGILVLAMFSPNSYNIRSQIVRTIHTTDFWSVTDFATSGYATPSTGYPDHIAEDFRIDERLLDSVAFRRNEVVSE